MFIVKLKDHEVKYVIIGASAFPVHGYVRATLDLVFFFFLILGTLGISNFSAFLSIILSIFILNLSFNIHHSTFLLGEVIMSKITILIEFWDFLKVRKKWWLTPIIIFLLLLGALIVFTEGSALAPFIYALF